MSHEHSYEAHLVWSGAAHGATETYDGYSREYNTEIPGRPDLRGSADPAFRGDPALHNPEDLLVASLAACHLLSYLALCARAGLRVVSYEDRASGLMAMKDKRIRFTEVVLRPRVTVAPGSDLVKAERLHEQAHDQCFIANSVNFPVRHEAEVVEAKV